VETIVRKNRLGTRPAGGVLGLAALIVTLVITMLTPGIARAAAPTVPNSIRIMPLGDSITWGVGSSTSSSYRASLWQRLAAGGIGADYVGSQSSGSVPDPANEGHNGWTIAQVAGGVNGWLAASTPDVILLHIGTNDVKTAAGAVGATGRLSALIDQIRSAAPSATVFVAEIVGSPDSAINSRAAQFDAAVPGIVAAKNSAKVRLVDQFHALTSADFSDSLHPNDGGYVKMAATWYSAMSPVLAKGGLLGTALLADRCLDVGAGATNGTPVQLWNCHGGGAQRWTRQGEALHVYGLCLEVPGDQTANGTRVRLWSCNGNPNQRWQLRSDGTIYNAWSVKCIDDPFAATALGTKLIIWDCKTSTNQVWVSR
jgi:lysophospholipase L1-like esterase